MHVFILSIGFGLVTASVLALAAVGVSLQFGVTNYINFAYGEFLTAGAYGAWVLSTTLHINVWIAMGVSALLVGLLSLLASELIMGPFVRQGASRFYLLIVTLGLSLILANAILAIWGSDFHSLNVAARAPLYLGPWIFTPSQLAIIGVAITAMLMIHLVLSRTRIGKAMRAVSDNVELAKASGIDTTLITRWTWVISGILAGLAGIVLALNTGSFTPVFGNEFLFVIFAAVILGGIGKPYGAMLGALVIGVVTEVSASFTGSSYKADVAFGVLILLLLVRPQGLIATTPKA